MENTNDMEPPINKDLSDFSKLQQREHYIQTEVTGKKTSWSIWQNYVIIGLLALMYFGNNENARLNTENDRLFRKNQEHAETREAMMGVVFNSPNKLERATKINTLRPNGFPFDEWNSRLAKNMIQVALDARQRKALEWVTEQPNWESVLSDDMAIAVREMVSYKHEGATLSAKQRLERAAKKSYELMVEEFERELARLEIKEEGVSLQNSQGN